MANLRETTFTATSASSAGLTITPNTSGTGATIYSNGDLYLSSASGQSYTIYLDGKQLSELGGTSGCLVTGTKISMADGTTKNIEEMLPGDEILSYDLTNSTTTTAVVIMNEEHPLERYSRVNVFEDETVLETVGEHNIFNVNGAAISDIRNWAVEDNDAAMKIDGTSTKFIGYFDHAKVNRSYNLIVSNNIFFANGIMNTTSPVTKFFVFERAKAEIPDELYQKIALEESYGRYGGLKVNNNEFIHAVVDLEKNQTLADNKIQRRKRNLSNTDYHTLKMSEKVIKAAIDSDDFDAFKTKLTEIYDTTLQERLQQREAYRQVINEAEAEDAQYRDQIRALKQQYGIIEEFDNLSLKDQFKRCNEVANSAIDIYRNWEWIAKRRAILLEVRS